MKRIFNESKILDENAKNKGLDESLLMENAGFNLARLIKKICKKAKLKKPKILFLLGGGNNAADGLVAIRHLKKAKAFKLGFKENETFKKQEQILNHFSFKFLEKEPKFKRFDIIVDCIFGSGMSRDLDTQTSEILKKANQSKAIKIACDLPSGLFALQKNNESVCFKADFTLCMGALKELLLEDFAKEFVGKIKSAKLGISHKKFTPNPQGFLLEKKDLKLIKRRANSNKGDFGHIYIFGNESAGSLAALAALNFGAGLVSLVAKHAFSPLIMLKADLETKANAVAIGMGLKDLSILNDERLLQIPLVLDAECFKSKDILKHLQRKDVIITPHPKEFTRLWKLCFDEELSLEILQKNRFFYARKFALNYECVLVLKGANPIIMQKEKTFALNLGTNALAKGGSGDVLSGMIVANLVQMKPLKAARNALLAHALVARNFCYNANSFDALKLIKGLKCL